MLAILVLATVLIITVSIAEVVHTELLIARTTDNSIVAAYAAESSLEEGVYRVRRVDGTLVSQLNGNSLTQGNGATWTRTATKTEPGGIVIPYLKKDTSYGFDIYDPETGTAPSKQYLVITPNCVSGQWIEVGYTPWAGGPFLGTFTKYRYPCANPIAVNIVAGQAYRGYVRSVTGDINGATVAACDLQNPDFTYAGCDMPGRVRITATGSFGNARRALTLSMPRIAPLSGLFSYAIFSECSIVKDVSTTPVPSPCP